MKQLYSALILVLITSYVAMGQSSVGINTPTPNTKSVLDLVSPTGNQGFLVPRLSTTQRQSMILGLTDRGMMVYDINLSQFWYWNGTGWKAGLGVLDETTASGDLNGTFPEVYINDDAVGGNELTDVGTPGTYGDDSTILVVTVDADGRVNNIEERNVQVRSGNIVNSSILNEDIANTTIMITKLDPDGNTDKVLAIDDFGAVYWEDQSAFTSSALANGNIYIGDAAGVAQGLPVSGDIIVTNSGATADMQLGLGVVTSTEIDDESIQSSDIMDLTIAEADIAAAAVTEQKIGADAVTAAKINPDVAGEALIPNATTGALDVNAGNGLLVAADSVEIDLQDIDGDGIVADLTDKELDVNVDDATLEVASDVVQVKNLGITNEKIANGTINAEAKISNINFNTTLPYENRILTINGASEVDWRSIGPSSVLATTPAGDFVDKPLSDFATNSLPTGSIFVGDGAGNAQPLFAANANQILLGNGVGGLTSVPLIGDVTITATDGTVEIQDNAVQGNDIDATSGSLDIAGIFPISLTTTSADGQAIQLDASGGAIDIGGNQGVLIDADNNDIDIDAIAGSVNVDANQNITLTSNNVALNPASNANITTTTGDITLSSGDGISMTGSTGSSFTTSAGDIDINSAGQLDLDGGTTVAINGAGGVSIASAANNVDVTADDNVNITGTNAAVGVTAGTSVDINANAGNVTIDAAGGGSDVLVTAPDQIEFDATNTQVVNGTFELANGGIQVDEIVDEVTVDLSAPSDNKLVAETALAQAIADQAGSGLTYDAVNQEIDLGGVLDQTADLVTAAGVNLQVSGLGILDVDTDADILGDVTLSGAAQSLTHTGATSLGVVSTTAPITIDAQGNTLTLDGNQGVSVDAASNDIDVTAATGIVNVTGNQGVNIDATNNNLTLDAIAGTLVLDGNSGVSIDASTSGDVTINSGAGSVSLDGAEAAGDAVAITASDVSGGIDLTAGTGGIAAVATDGDVSLTTSTTGDVILDGADDVTITGGTNVTTTATAGTATLTATAGEVDLTAGTTVDINAAGGNVTIDAAGAGNDIVVTAPDQVQFNGTNTQVVSGTFELANGGIQVDEIVDDLTVDLATPSDNKLITETALATAIGNQAGSGLTYDAVNQEIDLGGTLDQTADLVTAAGVNLQVSGLGILDVDTDADILGDVTLSGAAQNLTHTGATSLGVVSTTAPITIDAQGNTLTLDGDQGVSVAAASNNIGVVATTGVINMTGNQGVNVSATNNNLSLDANAGVLALDGDQGVSVDAASNDIDVTAATGVVNVTGNQGVNIDATNNNLTLDAIAGTLVLDGNSGVSIDASTSGDVTINSGAGSVSLDGAEAAGDAVAITASDVSGGIDLTAGTGGIAAVATDGDVSLTTSTTGDVILDGADDVTITGGTNVTTTATAGTATLTATAGEVDLTAGTTVDINAAGGNVTIDAAGAGNDIVVTAPDQVQFNGTNTQVVSGTFELANGGIQVDEIVDDLTVDLATPSDNKLITETALATAIGNQAGSGLTYDGASQEIDLGGTLDQTADLVTAAGVNLQVSGLGILDVDTDADILGDVTLSGAAQNLTHTGATSLGVVSTTAPITIDAQGNTLTLDGNQGVSVDAASNDIDVTAATGVVNVAGNQGVNIDATNNNLTLDAIAGTLVLDGNSGVSIDASTSGDVTINSGAGSVSIDGAEAAGDAVAITASDVSGGIDLTAGTGGIAAIATDGDVSLTTSTTGDVILDGADDVTVTGGTNVTTTATAGTATLTATAGEVDLTAGTTVDINAAGGNVTIDAVGAGNDIVVTAPDQVQFNGTNTQVVSGTFELANGGIQVDEIVDDLTVDLATPSDNKLITETALATAIGNQAGSGLTYDGASQEIDLGGTLDQTADLVTAAGVNLQVSGLGILDVDTDADILGDVTLSGAAQNLTHTGATSLGVVSTTAPITIDAQGNTLTLDGNQGVSVDAASNDIDVTAATGVVNVIGNQGVNIDATNNNLTLDAIAGTLVLDGNSGVSIDASTSGDVTINSGAGSVSIDGAEAAGDAVAITASDVSGGIDLTAGTGGIAAVATDGDVSLTTSTTGDVILDGADDVTVTGGTNVTTTATAGTATLTATAGEVDLTAGTTVDINAAGGNVTIDAAGAGNDIVVTAPDQIQFNGTNTQVVSGTFQLANGTVVVDEIVDDATVDVVTAPSDTKLVTESALASVTSGQAGSGLTFDLVGDDKIDLGGTLGTVANIVTGGTGENLQVSGTGILDVDTDADILGDITLSGAAQSLTHTGATSLGVVSSTAPITIDAQGNTLTLDGNQGVSVDAASNDIDVTAATGVVNVTGNQGINIDATNNNLTLDAIAGTLVLDGNSGVSIDASTSGDVTINSGAGSVSIDGAEAISNAVSITASDAAGGIELAAGTGDIDLTTTGEVTLNGNNTQIESGSFELNSGTTVTNIQASAGGGGSGVRGSGTADDNTLVTELAVRTAIDAEDLTAGEGTSVGGDGTSLNIGGGNAFTGSRIIDVNASNLTIDATGGGSFIVNNNAGGNFQVTGSGGNVTVDNTGNLDAANGLDVTTSNLTVGSTNFIVDNTGNVTAEGDTDLNGDLTVDGSTFSLDAAGASNVTTSTGGLTLAGADGVTITSTTSVGVAIDANTAGTVDIDGIDGVTLDASGGAIGIGTDADDQAINLGTAGDRTITLGTTGGTTGLVLDAGSGGIDLTGATNINGGSLTVAAGADVTFNDNVTVANGTTTSINSSTIGIGNEAADAVTIGGTIQGATPLTFNAGNDNTTFAINANSGSNRTITFPDADGTVVLDGDIT